MKIKNKIKFIILICSLIFVLSSCNVSNKKADFEIETPETILMGDSSLEDFYITVKGEKIAVTMDMFVDGTEMALYKEGKQTITISYNGKEKSCDINVVRRDFSSIEFSDLTVTYTGDKYKMEVKGVLPADVYVYYPYGNEFTNVGEYDVTAILSAPYYNTLEVKAKLTIKAVENNEK